MNDTPKTYDEQRAPEDFLREQKENEDRHKVDDEEPVTKEKVYITECQKCGQPLFLSAKSVSYEEREVFGCSFKVMKLDGKYLCDECFKDIMWGQGKRSITLKGVNMDKELVVKEAIVMPAVTAEKALEAWQAYQDLKKKVAESSDIQKIQGRDFLKKSYWRKIATFFNLSVEIVEEKTEIIKQCNSDVLVYHFRARATANNGRFAEGTGSCDVYDHATIRDGKFMVYDKYKKGYKEAEPKSIHNARTTAETRAWNRAVSNLVGGGEVSAEEIKEEITTNGHEEPIEETPGETRTVKYISDKQAKRLYAITQSLNVPNEVVKAYLQEKYHISHSKEITMDIYDDVVKWVEDYGAKNQPPKE